MPRPDQGHKSVTISAQTKDLLDEIKDQIPVPLSNGQVVHLALLALKKYDNPLDAAKTPSDTQED